MKIKMKPAHVLVCLTLAGAGLGAAVAAPDRSAIRVPDGLGFADFAGYETWEPVSVAHNEDLIKVITANPEMIRAYKAGIPANGKPFPDGAKTAKYEWTRTPQPDIPGFGWVAGDLKAIQFMEKDSKRFAASGGWGYAKFEMGEGGALKPLGTGTACGHACHNVAPQKDRVFTTYPPR